MPAGLGDQWVRCPGCGLSFPPRTAGFEIRPDEAGDVPTGEGEGESGVRSCPSCGTPLRPDALCCRCCGEDLEGDEEVHAWRGLSPGLRRDCEPHRGQWIAVLGNASIILAALALPFCGLPGLLGLPLGIAAWVMGSADLAKIRTGAMDPQGLSKTCTGRECGIVGAVLSVAVGLGWVLLWLVLGLS